MHKSAFFEPYRSVGFITDSTPFDLKHLGTENFISVAIGKSWQVFNCDKLRVSLVAPRREHQINAITSIKDVTFTSSDREIILWKRTHEVTRLVPPTGGKIYKLMSIGEVLISLSEDLHLYTWDCSDLKRLFAVNELEDAKAKASETHNYYTGSEDNNNATVKAKPVEFLSSSGIYEAMYKTITPTTHIQFTRPIDDPNAYITDICHPQTYMNKIVVSWSNGSLELWNIKSCKMIHRFANVHKLGDNVVNKGIAYDSLNDEYGQKKTKQRQIGALQGTSITCVEKSPAIDVVAIGTSSGSIILFNLKYDEPIHMFQQDGMVTSLAFRTDDVPYLVSASSLGHLTCWDLTKKVQSSIIRYAHNSKIVKIAFLPGLPILVSSGSDNAIHQWIYDQADFSGRWLRSRAGHSEPPNIVTFYDEQTVITGGNDRALRVFATMRDQHAMEFSQGSIIRQAKIQTRKPSELKLSKITSIAVNRLKEREWDNVLTAHTNDAAAMTWNFENKTLGKHKLVNENALHMNKDGTSMSGKRARGFGVVDAAPVTSVTISHCGNYGIVGHADGRVERYNIQSGLYRGKYGKPVSAAISLADQKKLDREAARKSVAAGKLDLNEKVLNYKEVQLKAVVGKNASTMYGEYHTGQITGVHSDAINSVVVTSSLDHTVRFWDFNTFENIGVLCLGFPVSLSCFNEDSNLLAVSTDDLRIHVIDIDSKKVVRRYKASHRLTCMTFSADGRILVAAQSNGDVKVFDLPSGRLVDWFTFDKPVVSLAFSPKNDFLATVHTGTLGVFLWVNRSYFSHQFFGLAVPSQPVLMDLSLSNVYSTDDSELTSITDLEEQKQQQHGNSTSDSEEEKDDIESIKSAAKLAKKKRKLTAATSTNKTSESETDDDDEDSSDSDDSDEDTSDSDESEDEETRKEREDFEPVVFAMKNPVSIDQMKSSVFGDLITLSGIPTSKWVQLPMLDQIRERNKAKEGFKPAPQAPFFLGVQTGVVAALDPTELKKQLEKEKEEKEKAALSRILIGNVSEDNALIQLCVSIPSTKKAMALMKLHQTQANREELRIQQILAGDDDDSLLEEEMRILNEVDGKKKSKKTSTDEHDEDDDDDSTSTSMVDYEDDNDTDTDEDEDKAAMEEVTKFLLSLSPADLDAEIRSLSVDGSEEVDVNNLFAFLHFLTLAIQSKTNFEFIQAVTNVFLKIHSQAICRNAVLTDLAQEYLDEQKTQWNQIEQYMQSSLAMINHFCNIFG